MKLKEWHRTIILIILIAIAVGFILWTRHSVDTNFINQL